MRTNLQDGTVVGFDGYSPVLMRRGVVCDPSRSPVDCGVASGAETVLVDGNIVMDSRHIPHAAPLEMLWGQVQCLAEATWPRTSSATGRGAPPVQRLPMHFPGLRSCFDLWQVMWFLVPVISSRHGRAWGTP